MNTSTIYLNDPHPFGPHTALIQARGWQVVNAPRPLCGEVTWEGEFRHGVFYAAGPVDRFGRSWEQDDAWPVVLLTNAEIEAFLRTQAAEADLTWGQATEFDTVAELARQYGLPWRKDEQSR